MSNDLKEYLIERINECERMSDFEVATDRIRCWVNQWEEINKLRGQSVDSIVYEKYSKKISEHRKTILTNKL